LPQGVLSRGVYAGCRRPGEKAGAPGARSACVSVVVGEEGLEPATSRM
jgi:hypothetical protein